LALLRIALIAPIAYSFIKSSPNKNTTATINDRVVVRNPRIELGYPGIILHQAPYLMAVQTSRDPKSHAYHWSCYAHRYARRPAAIDPSSPFLTNFDHTEEFFLVYSVIQS